MYTDKFSEYQMIAYRQADPNHETQYKKVCDALNNENDCEAMLKSLSRL